jgi:hypothetical protein
MEQNNNCFHPEYRISSEYSFPQPCNFNELSIVPYVHWIERQKSYEFTATITLISYKFIEVMEKKKHLFDVLSKAP